MKKYFLTFLLVLSLAFPVFGADTKITELDADTAPTTDDLVVTVDSPGSSPVNKKVTLGNFSAAMAKLFATTTFGAGSAITWTFDASAGTDTTLTFGDNTVTVGGNFFATSIGVTGTRIATGFFTDLTVTNAIAGTASGNIPNTLADAAGDLIQGSADNTWAKLTKGAEGTILRAGAASNAYSTSTFADTYAIGTLLHASGANTVTGLGAGATTEILVGGGAAAPVWTTATGTGAPVRADSPTFTTGITTPALTVSPSADPTITMSDSDAAATGTGTIYANALTAGQDSIIKFYVDDSAGEKTEYMEIDGVSETIDLLKPIVSTGAIYPASAGGAALGSATAEWDHLYLHDAAVIYGQADQSATITSAAGAWVMSGLRVAEVDGHTDQTALTAAQVSGTTIYNTGQSDADNFLLLPAAAAGYSFVATVGTARAKHFGVEAAAGDVIYLIAAAGTVAAGDDNAAVVMTAAEIGQSFACWTFKTDAYDWACKAIAIGTSTFAAHAHSTP